MRVRRSSVYAALIANGMFLSVTGGLGVVLAVGLRQPEWACAWLIVGIFGSELLLYLMLRSHCRAAANLEHLAASLSHMMEQQAATIDHEETEIAALCSTMMQKEQSRQIWYELTRQATTNLSSLVGGLEQAEASLPQMLSQTRAWVAQTRDLAVQIQTQVEDLADQVSGS